LILQSFEVTGHPLNEANAFRLMTKLLCGVVRIDGSKLKFFEGNWHHFNPQNRLKQTFHNEGPHGSQPQLHCSHAALSG